jgi:hypothetical protein
MRDLGKLRALTGAERRLLAVSLVTLPFIAAGLELFGFCRTRAALARWPRVKAARDHTAEAEAARALSVARVVAMAAGRGPVRTTCLRRCLLSWWILRWDGIETVIRVGVRREDGTIHAHAWIEHRGKPLNDAEDIALRFPAFAQDFGASPAGTS